TVAQTAVAEARAVARDQWRRFTATHMTPEQLRAIEELTPLFDRAVRETGHLEDILSRDDRVALNRFVRQSLYPAIDPVVARLNNLTTLTAIAAEATYRRGLESHRTALMAAIGAFALTILLILLAAYNVVTDLARPLERITRAAAQVTAGGHDIH